MPTPARTSLTAIVAAGRSILAQDGLDELTMQRVAEATGVRAPSLYKRVPGRAALVRLVAADAVAEVGRCLDAVATSGDPVSELRGQAEELRRFARADPHAFGLVFAPPTEGRVVDPSLLAAAAAPVVRVVAELVGPEQALNAARTVTAWASGFLRMELAGAFQLGGDVDAAFDYGISLLVDALGRHVR
ncbi:MAG: TetR/AcrR family transcriptional regulator [Propionibacteriaceae bacterium]|nr:TetR/AcrR family transcriptional regulator [Propionibacteriaceae bacterium]